MLFHSTRDDLTGLRDTNGGHDHFVRDLVTGTTPAVSVNASGTATGNAPTSEHFAFMTPDGTKVAFTSRATDLVFPTVNGGGLYVRDLAAGTTTFEAVALSAAQTYEANANDNVVRLSSNVG